MQRYCDWSNDMTTCDIGIYGLGVMGQNLALNFSSKGYSVAVYNRKDDGEHNVVRDFVSGKGIQWNIHPADTLDEFINLLKMPRKVLVIIKTGVSVDNVLSQLTQLLASGDIVIDGGNSHFVDTGRRVATMASKGIHFVGCGISGGSDGARNGASLMPGGALEGWISIQELFYAISAKSDKGEPCCNWIGPSGAGHFVKMVHNGIEYALMQLIAEAFDIMSRLLVIDYSQIITVLDRWCHGELGSYLIDITLDIFLAKDADGSILLGKVLDCAEQKGTGKDIGSAALDLGVSFSTIDEAVNSRFISSMLGLRQKIAKKFNLSVYTNGDNQLLLSDLQDALYCGQLIVYTQAFMVLSSASEQYCWRLNPLDIAKTWARGSIIRSCMLDRIIGSLQQSPDDPLLCMPELTEVIRIKEMGWRNTAILALRYGIPVPVICSALTFFDSSRSVRLPANLIQAQRDCFGAHGYERVDAERGKLFHSEWSRRTPNAV